MPASRVLPTDEAADLVRLVRELADRSCTPAPPSDEASETFPRDIFTMLGRVGVLGLPYAEEYGGGGQPYEVYLQVLEEIARVWASVGVGVSVHALSCFGLVTRGTEEQKQALPAGHARRRPARRLLPVRGARRLRPGRDAHPGPPRRRRVRARRHQGVGHPRRRRGLLQGDGADLRRAQRHLLLPGPGRHRRRGGRPAGAQDGADRLGHRDRPVRGRPRLRPTGCSAPRATASRSRSPASTRDGSASPRSRPGWPRARSTTRWPTPRPGRRSARRSSTTRASRSCSPTWPPRSGRPGRRTWPRPGSRTRACRSAPRRRSRRWWRPTTP